MIIELLLEFVIISSLLVSWFQRNHNNELTLEELKQQNDISVVNYFKIHDYSSSDKNICLGIAWQRFGEELNNITESSCFATFNWKVFYDKKKNYVLFNVWNGNSKKVNLK